ncbi:MAG: sodium-translocating pyrophosphatase [Sedimentisphaerales bacterium]|nr:sodium-translocating pyrophosphatase [Sedimentisphaerales bacterium]
MQVLSRNFRIYQFLLILVSVLLLSGQFCLAQETTEQVKAVAEKVTEAAGETAAAVEAAVPEIVAATEVAVQEEIATAADEAAPEAVSAEQAERSARKLAVQASIKKMFSPRLLLWWIAPIMAIVSLVYARKFYNEVKAADPGDAKMQEIAQHVTDGALAYLKRQYAVVTVFFIVVSSILFYMGWVLGVQSRIVFVAFLTGGFFSGLCGWLGMKTATLASNRTTQGAKESLNRGLTIAFRAGAVMGLVVVGFGLLDICGWYLGLTIFSDMDLVEITVVMLTFGMGASSQALFARVGGGIYTKAADVGADLVGKVEAGIPEDDPRNPATIADNVGDNVGDVAGMGADLYESYCGSILATAALGVSAAVSLGVSQTNVLQMLAAPMVLAGVGILLSIVGIYMVKTKEDAGMKELMSALMRGVMGSSVLILVAAFVICALLLSGIPGVSWLGIFGAICTGMFAGLVIGKATEIYTSYDFRPTREVASNAETGPATVIISGIAEGMKSTWMSLATVIVAIMLAYSFAGGFDNMLLGLYGVGIAAVSMLATLGITLATDAYGPIADNAGGNAEMTGQDPSVRKKTDALDSLGNTTAAMGKGFAIGSAALTALALMAAYVEEIRIGFVREVEDAAGSYVQIDDFQAGHIRSGKFVMSHDGEVIGLMALADQKTIKDLKNYSGVITGSSVAVIADNPDHYLIKLPAAGEFAPKPFLAVDVERASLREFMDYYGVNLMNPKVLCGIFSGVLLVFLFSALTMKAVGRAAMAMVREVRRQFKEIPGILEGTGKPEYAKCVAISTAGAQREMILPSMLALAVPIGVGLLLGVAGVLGLLAGGLACGFAMAIFMANAGGAWDNAKKYIETGQMGGKGSEAHKASVVGDTVGDPFKDTSGPSLNILIKLMSMVSVVFAGLIVKYAPIIAEWLHLG